MITPINPCEISVILQGPIVPHITEESIKSVHNIFPEAEVIISSWKEYDASIFGADKIIYSDDPGFVIADEVTATANNVNRQLVSTKAGLDAATRPYILKTRTDVLFRSASFLSCFGKYDQIPSPYFQNRLLICNYYTRNPHIMALCFHPSDWLLFGRAEDVRKYYDRLPLMTQEDGLWFKNHKKDLAVFTNYVCKYTPEQHIFISFLRQYQEVDCACYYDRTPELIRQTERAFAECFVVLDYGGNLDISFPKYDPNRYAEKHTLLDHWQWRALYEHYCGKTASARWPLYCARILLWKAVTYGRKMLICLLDKLGIKETVKGMLQNGGKHNAA